MGCSCQAEMDAEGGVGRNQWLKKQNNQDLGF